MSRIFHALLATFVFASVNAADQPTPDYSGLKLRSLGPGLVSGRVADIAVDPRDHDTWFVAAASGGVWKTGNAGNTWQPVFDHEGSYSIGVVVIDPGHSNVIWVGSGENDSQRSVSFGDGVYKSLDGGHSWKNMGLKHSEHIGKIVVDPKNSNTIFVAAQGPLWKDGGDRGLYRSKDGGESWQQVLKISPHTGINEVVMDPRNHNVLYASSYQRQRRVWTLIDGGPESAIYKSSDGGDHWRKLKNGLPKGDMGRIGLAISPANPDILYAIIEALGKETGVYRSLNAGEQWHKRSAYGTSSPQYYNELVADPNNSERVYALDTFIQVSEDGGQHFKRLGEKHKHVDNHALWIDPDNTDRLLAGCDGGVYTSHDRGKNWRFFENLPITQFYRVSVDYNTPFYHVYGGTQDNASLGGPIRTTDQAGISNADWLITVGGDGFKSQADPEDPNTVYSQYQYGHLYRFDRASGEQLEIQPQPEAGETLRWNWNSALIISPHDHKRLYFGANRLYQSDDRGNSWRAISADLTHNLDRNKLKIMGRVWGVDTVAKNASTSYYGTIVSLSESTLKPGLLYAGSDDGLIQVSADGGARWRKIDSVGKVPGYSYVSDLEADRFARDTVYASFDNHKKGDFKPYLYVSTDRGRHWKSMAGDLPDRNIVYAIEQDHLDKALFFVGTEFGLYFSRDSGRHWHPLKGGLPTIAVRDLDIQRRDNDLAVATFGRGIYILDDYTPLRHKLDQRATLFPPRAAWMYFQKSRLGGRGPAFLGETHYLAENPPYGAVFTYYLPKGLKTLKAQRREREKPRNKAGKDTPYPDWDALRKEADEAKPGIELTVTDSDGNIVRRLTGATTKGFHRVAWDMRLPAYNPTRLKKSDNPFFSAPTGPLVMPGTYQVSLGQRVRGGGKTLSKAQPFTLKLYNNATLPAKNRAAVLAFQEKSGALLRAVLGAAKVLDETQQRLRFLRKALRATPGADIAWRDDLDAFSSRLRGLKRRLNGDEVVAGHNEPTTPGIRQRVQAVIYGNWESSSGPTQTHRHSYDIAAALFGPWLKELRQLTRHDLPALEKRMDQAGAPWTPGRFPVWPGA